MQSPPVHNSSEGQRAGTDTKLTLPGRDAVLAHFRANTQNGLGIRVVLSDIDDTVFASLKDRRFPTHTFYPGLHQFYRELTEAGPFIILFSSSEIESGGATDQAGADGDSDDEELQSSTQNATVPRVLDSSERSGDYQNAASPSAEFRGA